MSEGQRKVAAQRAQIRNLERLLRHERTTRESLEDELARARWRIALLSESDELSYTRRQLNQARNTIRNLEARLDAGATPIPQAAEKPQVYEAPPAPPEASRLPPVFLYGDDT